MKNFKITFILIALFVSALFLTSAAQSEPCVVEQTTIVSQDTAQFLEYYDVVASFNYH